VMSIFSDIVQQYDKGKLEEKATLDRLREGWMEWCDKLREAMGLTAEEVSTAARNAEVWTIGQRSVCPFQLQAVFCIGGGPQIVVNPLNGFDTDISKDFFVSHYVSDAGQKHVLEEIRKYRAENEKDTSNTGFYTEIRGTTTCREPS
jgi:hypothetical protein